MTAGGRIELPRKISLVLIAAVYLSACAQSRPEVTQSINDPYEEQNRATHEGAKRVDRAILRPAALAYTKAMPDGIEDNISNFADTLSVPGDVVNQVLQGDLNGATRNTVRFAINATLGFGGLADVASDLGLPEDETDFGETLHIWGVREGPYMVLPVLGPSTERDAVGAVVDFALDPVGSALSGKTKVYTRSAKVGAALTKRGRFTNTIDSVLYDSADSYTQTRLIYLQNRRFELGQTDPDAYIDPDAIDTEGF